MRADFKQLHNHLNGIHDPEVDYALYDAALTATMEAFEMAAMAFDEQQTERQRSDAMRVCIALMPGMHTEAYLDANVELQTEAVKEKMKEMWDTAKVWAGKLWDGLVAVYRKTEEVWDDAVDKLDRRLSGEYVEINFPIKEAFNALTKLPGQIKALTGKLKAALQSEEALAAYKTSIENLKKAIDAVGTGAKKAWKTGIGELKAGAHAQLALLHTLTGDLDKARKSVDEAMKGEFGGKSLPAWAVAGMKVAAQGIADLWKRLADKSAKIAHAIKS